MPTQSSIPAQPPAAAAVPPASATSSQTTPAPASNASPPIHRGAIDRTTITTAPPARVMHAMRSLLLRMGVRVRAESAFRMRCSHILDPTASNANPAPDLRENSEANLNPSSKPKGPYKGRKCTLYGPSPSSDPSHEVRFSVELTQLAGLPGTYSLDIRRLKGHLRSYKFIYDTLRELSDTTPRSSIAQVPPHQHQLQLPHRRQFQPQRLQPND
ncbi:hypothetical protein CVT25_000670 [Psilocybe cyanescens]|uniref:non-specific serine/threonine protein kinase n=1 Tax=Psilocybe cyanescens TaxID=93625 RepID=A0A409WZH3_PSICY|nr:hypothetical protein CVT25_000670 [Psilocybe cyanescens]